MEDELKILMNSSFDLNWFKDNSEDIKRKHEGEIVAIKNKSIVAFAPNTEILFRKLKEKNIEESDVLIKAISPSNQIIIL